MSATPPPAPAKPVDRWDIICLTGAVLLFAGLWLWWSLGVALAIVGALGLALGVTGALKATPRPPRGDDGRAT